MPKNYFTFNKACNELMMDNILRLHKISLNLLRDAYNGVIVDLRLWKIIKHIFLLMGDKKIHLQSSLLIEGYPILSNG